MFYYARVNHTVNGPEYLKVYTILRRTADWSVTQAYNRKENKWFHYPELVVVTGAGGDCNIDEITQDQAAEFLAAWSRGEEIFLRAAE